MLSFVYEGLVHTFGKTETSLNITTWPDLGGGGEDDDTESVDTFRNLESTEDTDGDSASTNTTDARLRTTGDAEPPVQVTGILVRSFYGEEKSKRAGFKAWLSHVDLLSLESISPEELVLNMLVSGRRLSYLVPKADPCKSRSRVIGEHTRLLGPQHVVSICNGSLHLSTISYFLMRARTHPLPASRRMPDPRNRRFTEPSDLLLYLGVTPAIHVVDVSQPSFLGGSVILTNHGSMGFVKPDNWNGSLMDVTLKDFPRWLSPRLVVNVIGGLQPRSDLIEIVKMEEERIVVVPGIPLVEASYVGRLSAGRPLTIISGTFTIKHSPRMWAYDYVNGTIADLNVPIGKWAITSESTMRRLDGHEIIDSRSVPELLDCDSWMTPEEEKDCSFQQYTSSTTQVSDIFEKEDLWYHPTRASDVLRLAIPDEPDPWTIRDDVQLPDNVPIGRLRVIAGWGPVPAKLRSKNYREIEPEEFADFLGGPIFYNPNRDYPTQFVYVATIYDMEKRRRSSKTLLCRRLDRYMQLTAVTITLILEDPACPVWAGVVDIETREAPLRYTPSSRYMKRDFEVRSEMLVGISPLCKDVNQGIMVGNVANGRWLYRDVRDDIEDPIQLVVWHESVDDDPSFKTASTKVTDRCRGRDPKLNPRKYKEQKLLSDVYTKMVHLSLVEWEVSNDLLLEILEYLIISPDTYWINRVEDDGWVSHKAIMEVDNDCIVGLFDPSNWDMEASKGCPEYHSIPSDELIWRYEWRNLNTRVVLGNIHQVVAGTRLGCSCENHDGSYRVEFKFKNHKIMAARIIITSL